MNQLKSYVNSKIDTLRYDILLQDIDYVLVLHKNTQK